MEKKMKATKYTLFMTMLALCIGVSNTSFAQPPGRMYDLQTVETVSGNVVSVEQVSPAGPMGYGTHIILKTSDGEIAVHLGPSVYLSQIGLLLAQNDTVTVTGSKITQNNNTFIIASEVDKDGDVYTLRDKDGLPMWRGSNF